jgi:hypothetical protein
MMTLNLIVHYFFQVSQIACNMNENNRQFVLIGVTTLVMTFCV